MNTGLFLRKIYRYLKTGTSQTRDYSTYQKYLTDNPLEYRHSYFNLTIDFELAWSRARRGNSVTSKEESLRRSRLARVVLPTLLELSEKYKLPITFAVVAHVALKDCSRHDRPPTFSPFWAKDNWYDLDPHSNLEVNKDYYGADLIAMITSSTVSHEVASHGFSHVDLGDSETIKEVAEFEIRQSAKILRRDDPDLSTFVFPNNHPAYLDIVKDCGFNTYRIRQNQEVKKDNAGLFQFPLGLWISPQAFSSNDLVKLIDEGSSRKQLINFWCHLFEFESAVKFRHFFEPVFAHIESCQKEGIIEALTVRDIIKRIE